MFSPYMWSVSKVCEILWSKIGTKSQYSEPCQHSNGQFQIQYYTLPVTPKPLDISKYIFQLYNNQRAGCLPVMVNSQLTLIGDLYLLSSDPRV